MMKYNKKWGGVISFPREKWEDWYNCWVKDSGGKKFYRYLLVNNVFVGEAAYYFDEEKQIYMANIIVMAEYRGKGYGALGLDLLYECAKQNGIEYLFEHIAMDNSAISLF